jgi:hypothetical protein
MTGSTVLWKSANFVMQSGDPKLFRHQPVRANQHGPFPRRNLALPPPRMAGEDAVHQRDYNEQDEARG